MDLPSKPEQSTSYDACKRRVLPLPGDRSAPVEGLLAERSSPMPASRRGDGGRNRPAKLQAYPPTSRHLRGSVTPRKFLVLGEGKRRRGGGGHMGSFGRLARRAVETDVPVMVKMQELLRGKKDVMSLAQGVVHWQPPVSALNKVNKLVWEPSISKYGSDGLPELQEALLEKLRRENKLTKSSIMITSGANQAFVNLVLTLCDAGDSVVMFAPYYFNSYMSFQMTGVTDILVGSSNPGTLHPDVDWLEEVLQENNPIPKLVNVVNPGNPSGAFIPKPMLQICAEMLVHDLLLTILMNTSCMMERSTIA
ncbi:hypothetical protein GUJ93_ZPchr0008g13123 [Zizania palustris]|uniref:Aminotransferase class I/classII large domain-containing protein n=1 Tax=Zizania palustris TaxID=103762 RepID=A0A8J5R6S8_ZIZPA|nr:hypothetical protein GUJ93_ZPchr0008g13123 [Zizania palustris]